MSKNCLKNNTCVSQNHKDGPFHFVGGRGEAVGVGVRKISVQFFFWPIFGKDIFFHMYILNKFSACNFLSSGTSTPHSKVRNPSVLHLTPLPLGLHQITFGFHINKKYIYLLLAECEVRTTSYGPSFSLAFMAQARSARAMKTRKEKTRIHNLPNGPSKRG